MNWLCKMLGCTSETTVQAPKPPAVAPVELPTLPNDVQGQLEHFLLNTRFEKQVHATIIAQWRLETGHFSSNLCKLHNNFGGLKWRPEMEKAEGCTKVAYVSHEGYSIDYCKFTSIENFVKGYQTFIERSVYHDAFTSEHQATGKAFLEWIVDCGYCPTPGYVKSVLDLVDEKPVIITPEPIVTPVDGDKKIIGIVVGHNKSSRGASNYLGESEFIFNSRIAGMLKTELMKDGYACHVLFRPTGSYSSQCSAVAKEANKLKIDLAICLHFNAYNKSTQGCEVLILDTKSKIDNAVADEMTDALNEEYGFAERHDDGVFTISSSHAGYGMLSALRKQGVMAILPEPMFADDKRSSVIFEDEPKYVQVLLKGIKRGVVQG